MIFLHLLKKIGSGKKNRCDPPLRDPGGGGVNVARAIGILGGDAGAFVAVGGHTGQIFLAFLAKENMRVHPFMLSAETRHNMAIIERKSGKQYRFVMPGPKWDLAMANQALEAIYSEVPANGYVVLSGSNPPGVPVDFTSQLMQKIAGSGAKLIVDISGKALRHLTVNPENPPYLLRMNKPEAEELAGKEMGTVAELAAFARHQVKQGVAEVIILALGAKGSVLAGNGQCWHANAADVAVRSKVGAGDSFVGALTLALSTGQALPAALQKGVAAASAAVMTDATRLCQRQQAEALIDQCPLVRLD